MVQDYSVAPKTAVLLLLSDWHAFYIDGECVGQARKVKWEDIVKKIREEKIGEKFHILIDTSSINQFLVSGRFPHRFDAEHWYKLVKQAKDY